MIDESSSGGITMAAAKFIYKKLVERYRAGEDTSALSPSELVEEYNLWMCDEWTHIGHCIVTCLNNAKLIETYNNGNKRVLDSLIGKTIKESNMTVDGEFIRDMMPILIEVYFK